VNRRRAFDWLIGIAVAAIAIAASFYFDNAVWDFIRQHQDLAVYQFMRNVSRFGDWPAHLALGLLLLGVSLVRGNTRWSRVFLAMVVAMALAGVVGTVIKRTIPRARPSVHSEVHWGGPRFSSKYHSFPSGHMGASTAFFGVLFIARRRIGLACFAIPVLIGFSRMYIGAHYLSDVVCAAVLGILCALVVGALLLSQPQGSNNKLRA
jgi:membrane-associated phospholipid phosphatase